MFVHHWNFAGGNHVGSLGYQHHLHKPVHDLIFADRHYLDTLWHGGEDIRSAHKPGTEGGCNRKAACGLQEAAWLRPMASLV